jgi:hypothetical protein
MPNNHGLRTTGTHTGNFGRAKVQGRPGDLDLTSDILNRENLNIPKRSDAFTRLEQAYNKTSDPRLKDSLWEMLKRRRATLQRTEVKVMHTPVSEYWEEVKRVR